MAAVGAAAYLAGVWLIACIDYPVVWRIALWACWCADAAYTFSRFRCAARGIGLVRVGPRGITVLRMDGQDADAWLMTGSTVMRRLAWLRLASADGQRYQALFLARWTEPRDWHRLQLVWQLRDRGFGHPGGA